MMFFGWIGGVSAPVIPAAPLMPRPLIQTIVVDAGHGGKDAGAISLRGLLEKDVTLELARRVRDELSVKGISVIMTRDRDMFVPLSARARVANEKRADLFVSIHANASVSRSLKGFEIYYLNDPSGDKAAAARRAENLSGVTKAEAIRESDAYLKAVLWDLKDADNRRESLRLAGHIGETAQHSVPIGANRLRAANFYVLKWTECPSVLVELGYVSNRSDENKLRSARYRRKMAAAIAEGILKFKRQYEGHFAEQI